MHFRSVKDTIALPIHHYGRAVASLPDWLGRLALSPIGLLARTTYFLPGSHTRRTVTRFCNVAGRSDPWPTWSRMVGNIQEAALKMARLHRYGSGPLIEQIDIEPSWSREYERFNNGNRGILVLVPHCAGAVLSSAGLHKMSPTTLLLREPKSAARCELMLDYVQKLGPAYIQSRHSPPATVMRNIVRALRDGQVVVGTTDIISGKADTIPVQAFGETINSPVWPARIAARFNVPIVPGYIHMDGRRIRLMVDEGYFEADQQKSTQRWVSSFEKWFRQYPADWLFMLDKHWARVLARAAEQVREPRSRETGRDDFHVVRNPS